MSTALRLDERACGDPQAVALIGVSGGRDSMALWHALHASGWERLVVCHLDHGWRPESAAESRMVAATAERYGSQAVVDRCATPPAGEAAARRIRLEFFARIATEQTAEAVYLGHHADDQVETLLWNLCRGAGASGLSGMAPACWHTVGGVRLRLRRPLLGTWRAEIDAYVAAHRLTYAEDSSNADPRYTRNRLRHQLLPEMERLLGREVRRALWRSAEILAAEDEWISAAPELQDLPVELPAARVRAQPLAMQRRMLLAWLRGQGLPEIDFADVEAVRSLLDVEGAAKVNLPRGYHARRREGRLFIQPPA
jgi:tRNA(Ile)-lysidine synthase